MEKVNFVTITVFFILFPFVGFISGSDLQPIFPMLIFGLLVLSGAPINVYLLLISLLSISVYIAHALSYLNFDYLGYYTIHIVVVFIVISLYTLRHRLIQAITWRLLTVVTGTYLLVGAIQVVEPYFLSEIVGRNSAQIEMLQSSGRGVRSLTGEPSHFGRVLLILNTLFFAKYYLSKKVGGEYGATKCSSYAYKCSSEKCIICLSFFLLISNIVLTLSPYAVFFHTLFLLTIILILRPQLLILILISSVLIFTMVFDRFYLNSGVRLVNVFQILLSEPSRLTEFSAIFRLLNVPLSIGAGAYALPFGVLGHSQVNTVLLELPLLGELATVTRTRYFGGVFESWLFFGLLSGPFFLLISIPFVNLIRIIYQIGSYRLYLFAFWLFFLVIQDGSPANPMPWLVVFYTIAVFRRVKANKQKLSKSELR